MRISDWSSDVCSSDLDELRGFDDVAVAHRPVDHEVVALVEGEDLGPGALLEAGDAGRVVLVRVGADDPADRSEERRVGQECVRQCRSRWWPYHYIKHQISHDQLTRSSSNLHHY